MVHPTRIEFDDLLEDILGQRLPGRPKQKPFTQSEVQNYQIGSRLRFGQATWHYCQAGPVGQSNLSRGMGSLVTPETLAVVGSPVVGSYEVVINDATATHLANYWANGKIEIWWPSGVEPQHRIIKSSTASVGGVVTLTLYHPLTTTVPTGTGVEVCQSLYAQADAMSGHADAGLVTIVGAQSMLVTAEYFFWTQTWGIATVEVYLQDVGELAGSRTVYWYVDGTLQTEEMAPFVAGRQKAGVLIPDTAPGGANTGQTVVFLQMDP